MTAPTVVAVPMTGGGSTDRMTALVEVLPEGWVSLETTTARGIPTGGYLKPSEALELAHQLVVAAGQAMGVDQ